MLSGARDETFDIGEDTGTPVIEEYADKMPFRFTGKIAKVTIQLGEEKLKQEEEKNIDKIRREHD